MIAAQAVVIQIKLVLVAGDHRLAVCCLSERVAFTGKNRGAMTVHMVDLRGRTLRVGTISARINFAKMVKIHFSANNKLIIRPFARVVRDVD